MDNSQQQQQMEVRLKMSSLQNVYAWDKKKYNADFFRLGKNGKLQEKNSEIIIKA